MVCPAPVKEFDFYAEAEKAREIFPQLRENVLFAYTPFNPGYEYEDIQSEFYPFSDSDEENRTNNTGVKAALYEAHARDTSIALTLDILSEECHWVRKNVVVLKPDDSFNAALGGNPESLCFILDHELGHLLVPEGLNTTPERPYGEYAADAFASIRHIQRFGKERNTFLEDLSWKRAYHALQTRYTTHLTATVIDRIVADSAHMDFSSLSPAETIQAAKRYADDLTPSAADIKASMDLGVHLYCFSQDMSGTNAAIAIERLKLVTETALTTQNVFAFHVGVRTLLPFLDPSGILLNDYHVRLDEPYCHQTLIAFNDRARALKAADVIKDLQAACMPIAPAAKMAKGKKLSTFNI